MQDRETALKEALRRTISLMEHYWPRPNDEQAEAMNRAYRVLASPLSAPPQEPTGASPQAETRRDCTCLGTCRGAEGLGPRWKCALETPAPVSPVEPTPPTLECCACGHLNTPQQATRLEGEWRSSGEYVCLDSDACARRIAECSEPPVEPTPEPETCEWRITTGPLGIWVTPFCVEGSIPAPWGTERAKSCHLCGKPLRLVPSEETK